MLMYSIVPGLAAWGLALLALLLRRPLLVWFAFLCSALSATVPLWDVSLRAARGDFAGIEDTARALIIGVCFQFAVTLVLSYFALRKKI